MGQTLGLKIGTDKYEQHDVQSTPPPPQYDGASSDFSQDHEFLWSLWTGSESLALKMYLSFCVAEQYEREQKTAFS